MKPVFKILMTALAAAATLAAAPAAWAQGQYKPEYRMSTNVNNAFALGRGAELWAKLVNERTNGRIHVKWYPGSSLVGGETTREFTALRQGALDFNVSSVINWAPHIKELNLFLLPFLVPDEKAFDALIDGEVGKELFALVEKRGVVPLAWGENGAREISNSKREIRKPEDLKGMKFRTVGSPIFNDIYAALGANPTQMSFADAQPALQSGAVDGQENPVSIFVAAKMTGLNQKIVREAAIEAARSEIADARKGVTGSDDALLKEAAAAGAKVTVLTPGEQQAFARATQPVIEKWTPVIGADLVRKAQQAVAASRQ